jgi:hypothetical protein
VTREVPPAVKKMLLVWLAGSLMVSGVAEARRPTKSEGLLDAMRLPYQKGKIYRLQLRPGDPLLLELPGGDTVGQLWFDPKWWIVETEPGASQVAISASESTDVVGRKGFVHIVTKTRQYRISLEVEGVDENERVPAALEIYEPRGGGAGAGDASMAGQDARLRADRELLYAQRLAAEKVRAEVSDFKRRSLTRMRTDFEWRGDFRIARIVDDGVLTWILLQDKNVDRPVVQFIDQSGKAETVNCDLDRDPPHAGMPVGMYVVQKVLQPGEKFKLLLGKQATWISLKGQR